MAGLGSRSRESEREETASGFPPRSVEPVWLGRRISSIFGSGILSFSRSHHEEIQILHGFAPTFFMAN